MSDPAPGDGTSPSDRAEPTERPVVVAIVGAGPTGTGFLERLVANVPELLPGVDVEVHLVDPHPPGAGRVWRTAQSALLRMNSMAEDVTMFTDESVTCAGPVRPGPTLSEWIAQMRDIDLAPPGLTAELQASTGTSFPTRHLQSAYLGWVFDRVVADAPASVSVVVHDATAVALCDADDLGPETRRPDDESAVAVRDGDGGPQVLRLDDGTDLVADLVVLALGHLDVEPDDEQVALGAFAARHGLVYLPPAYTADVDLDHIGPGTTVVSRGMGLAFVDLVVLLTEGRGGRFVPDGDRLTYLASGDEPRILCGSRRGVPYHSKIGYRLQGPPPGPPRFLTAEAVDAALAGREVVDFHRDLWPIVAKELGRAHYHELFHAHPDRTTGSWAGFERRYAEARWDTPELDRLIRVAVPDPVDRLDLAALDRPLRSTRVRSRDELQHLLRDHIEADLARRRDPAHSADMAVFLALLSCVIGLPRLPAVARLDARSRIEDLDGWWFGFFSFYASGPPPDRLDQLLALSRAGVVEFLGADLVVRADEAQGRFVASSATVPGEVVADALVEARLPRPSVVRTTDRLLRDLHQRGEATERMLRDQAGNRYPTGRLAVSAEGLHVVDRDHRPHPRRLAVGVHTSRPAAGAFARPNTNAPSFRQNDEVARHALDLLGRLPSTSRARSPKASMGEPGASDRPGADTGPTVTAGSEAVDVRATA